MSEIKPNTRRHLRIGFKAFAAVSAEYNSNLFKEYNATCVNISEGGCCLEFNTVLSGADIDFGLKIGIDLADGKDRLIASGRIAWLEEENEERVAKYFVGIEFQNLSPDDKERIKKFVQSQAEGLEG